jgi:deoxyadenosine/deoxycytidine kinase
MTLSRYRYVVVEGPIGAGKTSLTHKLAERLNADTLLENASDNPFLPRFYQEPRRYAADAAAFPVRALAPAANGAGRPVRAGTVSDFLIDKDMPDASEPGRRRIRAVQKVYADLACRRRRRPGVYLQAPVDALKRVKRRGVSSATWTAGYLQRLTLRRVLPSLRAAHLHRQHQQPQLRAERMTSNCWSTPTRSRAAEF